jgi:hypothetical protein
LIRNVKCRDEYYFIRISEVVKRNKEKKGNVLKYDGMKRSVDKKKKITVRILFTCK